MINNGKLKRALMGVLIAIMVVIPTYGFAATAIMDKVIPLEMNKDVLAVNVSSEPVENAVEKDGNLLKTEAAYDNLLKRFFEGQSKEQQYNEDCYTVSGITKDGFPKEFAGAYVNKDLNLVVALTESEVRTTKKLATSEKKFNEMANCSNIIYTAAKHSYRDIVSAMDDIYQYVKVNGTEINNTNIIYYAIDDYNNCVEVGLGDISTLNVTTFKKLICNSDVVTFRLAEGGNFVNDITLKPGQGIRGLGGSYSLGYGAMKFENGKYVKGFVTAAHCLEAGTTQYTTDMTYIARVHETAQRNSGNLDAMFCVLANSGDTVGKSIAYGGGTLKAAADLNYAQGSPLTKVGMSTGKTTGVVKNTSYACAISGVSHTDFVSADYESEAGDSGGLVMSTRNGNYIAGIHSGHHAIFNIAVFCKVQNINSAFNLTLG